MNISSINDDCLLSIFSYLDIKEKVAITRVCRRWLCIIIEIFMKKKSMLIVANELYLSIKNNFYDLDRNEFIQIEEKNFLFLKKSLINFKSEKKINSFLSLSITRILTSIQFENLISKFQNLNLIKISSTTNCPLVSPAVLNKIAKSCKELTSVDLSNCKEVNTECLIAISENCLKLKSLNLNNCRNYGNIGIKRILKSCIHLNSLSISHNRKLSGLFFSFCKSKQIEFLDLTECTGITYNGFSSLQKTCRKSLKSLITFPIKTNQSFEIFFKNFENLKKLKIKVTNHLFFNSINNPIEYKIISLSIEDLNNLNEDFFSKFLQFFKDLEEFEFHTNKSIKTFYPFLNLINYWPKLKKLSIRSLNLTRYNNIKILKLILSLKFIKNLYLNFDNLNDEDLIDFLQALILKVDLNFFHIEFYQNKSRNNLELNFLKNQFKLIEQKGFYLNFDLMKIRRNTIYVYLSRLAGRKI